MNCTEKDQLSSSKRFQSWQTNSQGIEVYFDPKVTKNVAKVCFPWMWLRDHCQCSSCFTATAQRESDVFLEWDRFDWEKLDVETDSAGFIIQWQDGHTSYFADEWLEKMLIKNVAPIDNRKYWSDCLPIVDYQSVIDTDLGLRHLVENLAQFGVCKVTGAESIKAQASQLMQRISYLRQSVLGDIFEIKPSSDSNDDETHLHTDGTFNYDPPGIKLVQCLEKKTTSCQMVFVDGLAVVEKMKDESPQTLNLLQNEMASYQYIGQDIHLMASEPTVILDSNLCLKRIRYNPKLKLPLNKSDAQTKQAGEIAERKFKEYLEDEAFEQTISLSSGEMVLWDNWRVLHGGSAMNGNHHLAVCIANMEDFHSHLRVIQDQNYQRPVPQPRTKGVV